jgi:hypothetical protein
MTKIQFEKPKNELNQGLRFYSQKAIALATYFGGPLAAGVLVRQNFINLGKEESGKNALITGIVSTLLLFVGLFSVPDHIIDKIPNAAIPAIYTGIIYLIVERLQGQTLKIHKEQNGLFYSGWKATGIGAICLVILMGGIFGYAYLSSNPFDTVKYDNGIAEFQKNEEIALTLFTLLETSETSEASAFIQETGIPKWLRNMQILNELDKIEGLSHEFRDQNQVLREYCQLRIQSYQLIKKAISENTNLYDPQIEGFNKRIEEVLTGL